MKAKKVPLRQCVGCRLMKEKKDMIRVVKLNDDSIMLDTTGKLNGRGAYLCNSLSCFQKAVKSSAIERSLKTSVEKEVYESLERQLMGVENTK